MTVVCPEGHASADPEYCDQCGLRIPAAAGPPQPTQVLPALEDADTDASPAAWRQPCPVCQAGRSGEDRYCEACGHDFLAPPPVACAWEAVAGADRAQFIRRAPDGITFPAAFAEKRFPLDGTRVRIGRSRAGQDDQRPEIDLAGAVEDPGISRLHAILERREDGSYALRDLGSTNGTTVNDDPAPVSAETATPLADGDRIRIGAWTTITVRRL
ncbi:MAG TPA: FHA domain-containing protein [Solirubrobacteraceae bacterium]